MERMEGNSTEAESSEVLAPASDLMYNVTARSVLLVFGIDGCIWIVGVLLFIIVHYVSFHEPSTLSLTGKNKIKNWLHRLFYKQVRPIPPLSSLSLSSFLSLVLP